MTTNKGYSRRDRLKERECQQAEQIIDVLKKVLGAEGMLISNNDGESFRGAQDYGIDVSPEEVELLKRYDLVSGVDGPGGVIVSLATFRKPDTRPIIEILEDCE